MLSAIPPPAPPNRAAGALALSAGTLTEDYSVVLRSTTFTRNKAQSAVRYCTSNLSKLTCCLLPFLLPPMLGLCYFCSRSYASTLSPPFFFPLLFHNHYHHYHYRRRRRRRRRRHRGRSPSPTCRQPLKLTVLSSVVPPSSSRTAPSATTLPRSAAGLG